MDTDNEDPERPARLQELAFETSKKLEERQRQHVVAAQQYGYASVELKAFGRSLTGVRDNPLFAGQEETLKKFQLMVDQTPQAPAVQHVALAATFVTSTGTTTAGIAITSPFEFEKFKENFRPPSKLRIWTEARVTHYSERLDKIRAGLGTLSLGAWEQYHSGAADRLRGALGSMRELMTQFFAALAPDEEVRASDIFKVKQGDKPQQVYRRERIMLAGRKINNAALRDLLLSATDDVLGLMEELNRVHTRGDLDDFTVRGTLVSAQSVIDQWVEAIDPDGGIFPLA